MPRTPTRRDQDARQRNAGYREDRSREDQGRFADDTPAQRRREDRYGGDVRPADRDYMRGRDAGRNAGYDDDRAYGRNRGGYDDERAYGRSGGAGYDDDYRARREGNQFGAYDDEGARSPYPVRWMGGEQQRGGGNEGLSSGRGRR